MNRSRDLSGELDEYWPELGDEYGEYLRDLSQLLDSSVIPDEFEDLLIKEAERNLEYLKENYEWKEETETKTVTTTHRYLEQKY